MVDVDLWLVYLDRKGKQAAVNQNAPRFHGGPCKAQATLCPIKPGALSALRAVMAVLAVVPGKPGQQTTTSGVFVIVTDRKIGMNSLYR
jgi:hypothetical protein